MSDGTTCSDEINVHRYIQEASYSCTNQQATDKYLREMRLSFPSGHASFGFYSMVYLAVSLNELSNILLTSFHLKKFVC